MTSFFKPKTRVQPKRDEIALALRIVAIFLVIDILSSSATALPGHNHLEPIDTALKALTMLLIAAIAYARPVEFGAQLLDNGQGLAGLSWLALILGAPFLLLLLMPVVTAQIGLAATLVCAILAHLIVKIVAPVGPHSRLP